MTTKRKPTRKQTDAKRMLTDIQMGRLWRRVISRFAPPFQPVSYAGVASKTTGQMLHIDSNQRDTFVRLANRMAREDRKEKRR